MNSVSSLAQQFKPFLDWNKPRIELLAMLIVAILKKRTVNWTQLITTFPTTVKGDSCYRRVQRFFCEVSFDQNTIALLIAHLFAPNEPWTLSMDRTNWMFGVFKINILYLAINYKGMSIPLLWTLLDKKGNSNTTERIELMDRFLKIFPTQRVKRLLADREFKGKEWLNFACGSQTIQQSPTSTKIRKCPFVVFSHWLWVSKWFYRSPERFGDKWSILLLQEQERS